ncbi:hypothetical protein TYRP_020332 [Tyrophagus putrescentiae]|nr:hypothetical protein TYRP_020332 [Tyrophagus putrescentiae]
MFQILKCGNSYYESNMKEILESHPMFFSYKQLSFHTGPGDIRLKNVKIFGKKVVVRTGEEVMAVGLFDNEVRGLKNIGDALKEFFDGKLNTAALVICGHSSRAIMKRTYNEISKYYLFDSHEFDSKTAFQLQHSLVGDRNAAFVAFDSADSLICTYKNLVYKINPRIQLDLTEIMCETNENGDANNFFDIDNYNSSDNVNLEESLMIVLGAKGAVQAVESALSEKDPRNLIARGLILQAGPTELQTPIKQMKVAYEMLQTLQAKYEKNESTDTQEKSRQRFYYD